MYVVFTALSSSLPTLLLDHLTLSLGTSWLRRIHVDGRCGSVEVASTRACSGWSGGPRCARLVGPGAGRRHSPVPL